MDTLNTTEIADFGVLKDSTPDPAYQIRFRVVSGTSRGAMCWFQGGNEVEMAQRRNELGSHMFTDVCCSYTSIWYTDYVRYA